MSTTVTHLSKRSLHKKVKGLGLTENTIKRAIEVYQYFCIYPENNLDS